VKISEVIKELQAAFNKHGDIDVVSDSADGCLPIQLGGVDTVVDDDGTESQIFMLWGLETVEKDD